MNRYLFPLLLVLVLTVAGCKSKPSTLMDSFDEEEMEAAIARARGEVDSFLRELANPTGTDHAVKVPVEDDGKTEHFWIVDIAFENGSFVGTINNDPGLVSNVRLGQEWTVGKDEISDWMFMRGGKIHGNYTMRPLLKGMPKDEADAYREMLAEP